MKILHGLRSRIVKWIERRQEQRTSGDETLSQSMFVSLLSKIPIYLNAYAGENPLGSATGFFIEHAGKIFFVTNWHVVSGCHPESGEVLDDTKAVPHKIVLQMRPIGSTKLELSHELPLYRDEKGDNASFEQVQNGSGIKPIWFEHPQLGRKIDVVAIPFDELPKNADISRVTKDLLVFRDLFTGNMQVQISDDVHVLGYPLGIERDLTFPIWKRASIAYEPQHKPEDLPKLLIDTATRPGMSGSPVIWTFLEPVPKLDGVEQPRTLVIGVYSGRLGADEVKAQLGIVWRIEDVVTILTSGIPGKAID